MPILPIGGSLLHADSHMNSNDANIAQNVARREIQMLLEPLSGLHQNVILYWQQVNKDTENQF